MVENEGLSNYEYEKRYNMIKGRIAETLIEELFLSLGYNVFRYGMENTVPAIIKLLRGIRGDVANNIRSMPDFVVQNPNNNEVYFIEVKFRSKETFTYNDLIKEHPDYPYKNAYVIIVSKRHIKCITVKELEAGEQINPASRNFLGNRKEFHDIDKEKIKDFCNFAVKFFKDV